MLHRSRVLPGLVSRRPKISAQAEIREVSEEREESLSVLEDHGLEYNAEYENACGEEGEG